MALTNYGELKTAVANWLERDDLTNRIPEFIALAENRIGQTIRVRTMESSATIAATTAVQSYSLPTRYVQFRRVYITGTPEKRLEYRTPINFWSMYAPLADAKPDVFTIEGENILFGPTPDSSYTVDVLYYQRLAAFSADVDTNSLLSEAAGLYLYGALVEAAPYLENDPRLLIWAQMWEDLKARVEAADRRDRFSGDARIWQDVEQMDRDYNAKTAG